MVSNMKRFIQFFVNRSLLVNVVSVALLLSGLIVISRAQREAFPRIEFDYIIVTTIFPGATPEDVEKHVTIALETELRNVDGIDELSSGSYESLSVIAIKLDPDLDDKIKTVNDIKNAIDRATDLPSEAEKPVVTELAMDMIPVMEIALINKKGIQSDVNEFENRKFAKILEERILEINGVARVEKSGYRNREMLVEASPEKMDRALVGMNDLIYQLSRKNLNFPGGTIKSKSGDILIRTIGEVETPDEIGAVLVRSNDAGNAIRVRDVAKVRDTFEEEKIITKADGRKTITLTVMKKQSADIIELVDQVQAELESFREILPPGYESKVLYDMSFYVKRRLNVLVNNAIVGIILVVGTLFFTLGWRIAVMTALGLPIAIFGTFIWMDVYHVSINLMSMFGLIMVLGMLVDDAIVVSENIYRHLETGDSLKTAVIDGTTEVIVPVAATVLTTLAAFSPLMFMSGIMGKFIWTMPAIVSVALLFSWGECMMILPSHIHEIERKLGKPSSRKPARGLRKWLWVLTHKSHPSVKRDHVKNGHSFLHKSQGIYRRLLGTLLKHRYWTFAGFVLFLAGTLLFAAKYSDFILFPKNAIEALIVKVETPTGTTLEETNQKVGHLEKIIGKLPDDELDNFTSRVGIIQESPMDPYTKNGSSYATIRINLTPFYERERDGEAIMDDLRTKFAAYNKEFVKLEITSETHGPPVGKAVNVTIKGDDYNTIEEISGKYRAFLASLKGVRDIKDNYEGGKDELKIYLRPEMAAVAGITVFDVATTVRSCFEGTVATTIKKTDEEIHIRVKFPSNLLNNKESLAKVKIANMRGQLIPLGSVVRFEQGQGISVLNRKDWRRTVAVTADIDEKEPGVTSLSVNNDMKKQFKDIAKTYPGYTVNYEGEFKDTQESMDELLGKFLIAALIIYVILVALFRSLIYPLVIITVIPFTFAGVIWIFFFHNMPVSFLSLLGVVGLAGVVVNDSILLMDFIKKERKAGIEPITAAIESGVTRLRPVFLTTITTFFGLIPTAYGIGGFDPFLKPMAISLSWGLFFGTIITLGGTPVFYVILNDLIRKLFRHSRL